MNNLFIFGSIKWIIRRYLFILMHQSEDAAAIHIRIHIQIWINNRVYSLYSYPFETLIVMTYDLTLKSKTEYETRGNRDWKLAKYTSWDTRQWPGSPATSITLELNWTTCGARIANNGIIDEWWLTHLMSADYGLVGHPSQPTMHVSRWQDVSWCYLMLTNVIHDILPKRAAENYP